MPVDLEATRCRGLAHEEGSAFAKSLAGGDEGAKAVTEIVNGVQRREGAEGRGWDVDDVAFLEVASAPASAALLRALAMASGARS
ncbi:hypothetical protein ACOCJ7_09615 [Knoellia sp. CPCC 206453]|uniref:hypothetical protein n=1 Tax=Knoellia pratensis TaxID=3404796 RepID=UPI003B42D7B1